MSIWRDIRIQLGLLEIDKRVLRGLLVARYLRDIAPQVVMEELRSPEVLSRIDMLATSKADLVAEVLESPKLVDDLHRATEEDASDIQDYVRRRNRKRNITLTAYVAGVIVVATIAGLSLPDGSEGWDFFGGILTVFLGFPLIAITMLYFWEPVSVNGEDSQKNDEIAFSDSEVRGLLRQAGEEVIRPHTRRVVNRHLDAEFGPILTAGAAPGLRDARAERFVVATAGFREAVDRIGQLDSGAVIITGARGTGKSALIQHVLAGQASAASDLPGIAVMVPSVYDPREFILHLHSVACRTVIDHELADRQLRILDRVVSTVGPVPAILGAAVGSTVFLVQSLASFPIHSGPWRIVLIWAAAVLALAGILAVTAAVVTRLSGLWGSRSLLGLARADLARVRYLRTFTEGWSGKVAVPWGDATVNRSQQMAERSRSLPEVVEDFRHFIIRIVDGQRRLVIAIDELDKLADLDQAERFIADIRAILDIPGCVYLAALSSDAMAHFGRRTSTTKTSLDSSFDLAVRMRPMTAVESSDALATRVVGFSRHFRLLAHLASGGRPRELVRVARKLIDHARTSGGITMADGARLLVAELGEEHLHAMAIALRDSTTPSVRKVVTIIAPGGDIDDYDTAIRVLAKDATDSDPLCWELLAYHAYLATLRRFFESTEIAENLLDERNDLSTTYDILEKALQILPDDPQAAWEAVDDARTRAGATRLT